MTAYGAVDIAVESIRKGAYHYLSKPFKLDELVIFLERALDDVRVRREATALRRNFIAQHGIPNLVGRSAAMREVVDLVERVADVAMPVLLLGETGTGKGLVARALHSQSARAERPFVAVNCAAIPDGLLESELFGHVKGAFTGADQSRPGLFVEASGGTLFLDEVAEMSPALQAKLLTAIESGTVRPVGSSQEVAVNVRLVAATNRDLRERVRAGAFREDLVYRLDVVSIVLPALRHRREDIPSLVDHFLRATRARYPGNVAETFSPGALALLLDYEWPGNVRELSHLIERLVVLGRTREIGTDALPTPIRAPKPTCQVSFEGKVKPIREIQRMYARWAMDQMGGSKVRTAASLGVDVKTLTRWLEGRERDLETPEKDAATPGPEEATGDATRSSRH
jgi:two-component system response regulator HydG